MSLLFLQHRRFEEESLLMLVDLSVVLELVASTPFYMYQGYRILGFPREEYSQPKHESGIKYVTTDSVTTYPVKSQHYFTSVSNSET